MRDVLITAGATREYVDSIRYISNGSSGRQGYALAECMGRMGWNVKLISGPAHITPNHELYEVLHVETSAQMLEACLGSLPVDVAICTAAVTDWIPHRHPNKLKKCSIDSISMTHSPDIVRCISMSKKRPKLVIGFCLEHENLIESSKEKLAYKGCDWIIANNQYVTEKEQTMGSAYNKISIVKRGSVQHFQVMTKQEVANLLTQKIVDYFSSSTDNGTQSG
ncbi:phosphopantothenoylcysteine decarboxylase [Anaplasma capra]|uniref:phosphopantothenoylcysteine decarboxylase n=1 Tax=Anaplasma capra TaxID=1562740 RepID=UPI0021D5CD4A|nr:phosphopantothenoylcysteine decarboxylase [Anaplasma capra]MCU7611841.1 phosphopantothenoylcysteine decarboxylase [Anaplasma capra]MCU7612565.1 phosphopantothenoylcysteine decarboxylase [Anaplasma capra]